MRKTSLVLAVLLAVAGICVMLWPVVTGNRLQSSAATAVQEFLAERNEPEQQYPELLAALQEYNHQLYAEKQCNLVDLEACEEPAVDLAAYGIDDEIIGVLEIPAMELTMPVYLGALDDHLAAGATVLGNTSAPIGGDNTNCVIAGHRGWRGADYFRYIDRLQVGDTVTLTNLWETLTYTVTDIQIIQPHEVDKIKIQQGRDLLTLLTCHLRFGWAAAICGVLRENGGEIAMNLIGKVTFVGDDDILYDDADAFLDCIREELPYRDTTGFRYEVLTDDPAIRKAADDILFDFLGEENPCELEDYTQTMGGI